jgi:Beta-lactamase
MGLLTGGSGPVRDCFAEVVRAQPGTGAGFAAWCDGRLVADLWGGYADLERRRPWQASSLVQPYSVSKPFAAVCALGLVEAGRLDLDAPVQRYWPEFRARRRYVTCSRIRPGWWHWTGRCLPRPSMTGTGCARCWPRSRHRGRPGPRTANQHCSTGTWSVSWPGAE